MLTPTYLLTAGRRGRLLGVVLGLTLSCSPMLADAQTTLHPANGAQTATVAIAGQPMVCSSNGKPIDWVADYALHDVGNTQFSPPAAPIGATIRYNPAVLNQMPDHLKIFWLGHECAHAYLPTLNESLADCWSATRGVQQGWFGAIDADTLAGDMALNPGDFSHPPGLVRVAHVKGCMAAATANQGSTTAGQTVVVPPSTTKALPSNTPFEEVVSQLVAAAPSNFDSIKGAPNRDDSLGVTFFDWESPDADMTNCSIAISDDARITPTISCDAYVGADDTDDAAAVAAYSLFAGALRRYANSLGGTVTEKSKHSPSTTTKLVRDTLEMQYVAPNSSRVRIRYNTSRYTSGAIDREIKLWVDAP